MEQEKEKTMIAINDENYQNLDLSKRFQNISSLQKLNIQLKFSSEIETVFFSNLSNEIKNMKQLEEISVELIGCSIISSQLKLLFSFLQNLNSLLKLNIQISNNYANLRNEFGFILKDGLQSLQKLQFLSFKLNDEVNSDNNLIELLEGIGQLKQLTHLQIQSISPTREIQTVNNQFKHLNQLINLQSLTLDFPNHSFKNSGFSILANVFTKLMKLDNLSLVLFDNYSYDIDLKDFFLTISQLKLLRRLSITITGSMYFGEKNSIYFGDCLKDLSHLLKLEIIIMEQNQINLIGIQRLCQGLSCLSKIQSLLLKIGSFNNLCHQGAEAIGQSLLNLTQLTELYIFIGLVNKIKHGTIHLFEGFSKLTQLEKLSLSIGKENGIGDKSFIGLNNSFVNLLNLKHLEIKIEENEINIEGAQQLGKSLSHLIYLTNLKIHIIRNDIKQEGLTEILLGITNLKYLKILNLKLVRNYLNQSSFNNTKFQLKNINQILDLKLSLDTNRIGFQGIKYLFLQVQQLIHLKKLALYLKSCNIGQEGYEEIMKSLSQQQSLRILKIQFDDNQIQDYLVGLKEIRKHQWINDLTLILNIKNQPDFNQHQNETNLESKI